MRKIVAGLFLTAILIASSWSLFRPGFFRVHDYVHGARIAEMARALQDGHFPVRWTSNFSYGYGMPLFEFYAPLPFYVGSVLYLVGFDLITSIRLIFLLTNLGTTLGAYKLGKRLFGLSGGIILAACLTLAPYRAVNLFVRGALGEAWGIMALPWILYYSLELYQHQKQGDTWSEVKTSWLGLIISLVVLLLSHNLVSLMFLPLAVVFMGGILLVDVAQRLLTWKSFGKTVGIFASAYLLSVGVAAFYLFPALVEKGFTQIDTILGGYFHYSHHFLYIRQFFYNNWGYGGSAWGPDDDLSFFLGYGQIIGLVLTIILIVRSYLSTFYAKNWFSSLISFFTYRGKPTLVNWLMAHHFSIGIMASLVLIISLYLTLLKSLWIWDSLPLISFIQFPWRWLAPATVMIALLIAWGSSFISMKMTSFLYAWLITSLVIFNAWYFQPEFFLDDPASLYYEDAGRIRTEMSSVLPDYMPKTLMIAAEQKSDATAEDALKSGLEPLTTDQIIEPSDQLQLNSPQVLLNRTHQKLVSVTAQTPTAIIFDVAAFPGWVAEIDGKKVTHTVTNQGLIQIEVPAGTHQLGVYFGSTPIRFFSDLMSLATIGMIIFILIELPQGHPKNSV